MRFHKKIEYSLIFAFIIFGLALFVKFIPCQTSPAVPNPQYTWTVCDLNPDSKLQLGITTKYLSYTQSLRQTYIILLLFAFTILYLILSLITREKS